MPEADPRPGRWLRRGATALVLLVLLGALGAAVAYRLAPGTPAQVPPPAGLSLPAARQPAPVAAPTGRVAVDRAAVRRAVASLLRSSRLGGHVVVDVEALGSGSVVYRHGAGAVAPASTMKLLTTVAALEALRPDHRFTTSVVATPQSERVVLVGGGDPLLGRSPAPAGTFPPRADLETLADRTAKALKALGRSTVRVGYDTTLFSGPALDPHWEPSYFADDVVSRISPLWVDEGRRTAGLEDRSAHPATDAAEAFAQALERRHITVVGRPGPAVAPPASSGGGRIAVVRGAPLATVVQHVLEVSDNDGAEVLARQVAVAQGEPASFAGAARAVRAVLGRLGISTRGDRIYDGSGLSRHDRLRPETLLAVIRTAAGDRPGLRSAVAGLPVAGFTGSLASRFVGLPAARGTVRAKTGTLTGVDGLAGTVTTRDGALLGFVAIADRVRPGETLEARDALDRVAAALAGCACAATP
ncbi:MAG: hypothetical protein QOF53_103 [Nocardioidaceae bacterium]|nr:hypothetical protein [Nocardioidaceae bacterium]